MCQFFSCISDGRGKIRYFDKELRQQIRDGKLHLEEDSHSSIADYYRTEIPRDRWNGYEYNPITGVFVVDKQNAKDDQGFVRDDRAKVDAFCKNLDFNTVVPNWAYLQDVLTRLRDYKPVNPYTATRMPAKSKLLPILKELGFQAAAQVWTQVGNQVEKQVWTQVGEKAAAQVRDQVWTHVGNHVWAQVRAQVCDQVCDQVRDQVWNQARVAAYYAIKLFMPLDYEHPIFDLLRLGVMVVNVLGKIKVFGKDGKFLGETDERNLTATRMFPRKEN